jgi:hypothetical protein
MMTQKKASNLCMYINNLLLLLCCTARDLKAANTKLKLVYAELSEVKEGVHEEIKTEKVRLELKLNDCMKEINDLKYQLSHQSSTSITSNSSSSSSTSPVPSFNNGASGSNRRVMSMEEEMGVLPGPTSTTSGSLAPSSISQVPSGFVVQLEKLHQEVKKKEIEAKSAKERLQQVWGGLCFIMCL